MPYLRVDDNMTEHPKVEHLSDRAFRMYVRGLCYSARLMTDGLIPRPVAQRWGTLKRIGELLAAGLWVDAKNGYEVHDYLDWNDSRDRILERRRADSARKSSGIPPGIQPDSARNPSGFPGVGVGVGKDKLESAFARLWAAAPRAEKRGACWSLFRTLVADGVDPEVMVTGAERHAERMRGTETRYIASLLTWLQDRRWEDASAWPSARPDPDAAEEAFRRFVEGSE